MSILRAEPAVAPPQRSPAIVDAPPPAMVAGRRPADVLEAATAYARTGPNLGSLSAEDARRGQQLVHEALSQLPQPRIQVNRRFNNALSILRSDAPMPTMFDQPENRRPFDYDQRRQVEREFDIHGRGEDAGRTVYGSVQFGDELTNSKGKSRLNVGNDLYGPVSLVLKPSAWARTTVLPGDSYFVAAASHRPAAIENLGDVTAEYLHRFGALDGPVQSAARGDARRGVEEIKRALTSTLMVGESLEAAVRRADRSDIAEIRVERRGYDEAELRFVDRQIRRLRYHAGKLGIPVHQKTFR